MLGPIHAACSVQRPIAMRKTVKHRFYSIGDHGGIARSFGSGTVDLARRFGARTTEVATRIGPRRGLFAFAVIAAAIAGSIAMVRYRRARNLENEFGIQRGDRADREYISGFRGRGRRRASAQERVIIDAGY